MVVSIVQHWNGLSMMQQSRKDNPDTALTSDASAVVPSARHLANGSRVRHLAHYTFKELLPMPQSEGGTGQNKSQVMLHAVKRWSTFKTQVQAKTLQS